MTCFNDKNDAKGEEKMPGSQIVLNKIRSGGKKMIGFGIPFLLLGIVLTTALAIAYMEDREESVYIVLGIITFLMVIEGLAFIIMGVKRVNHPERAPEMRNNPNLLQQADQLYSNIIYEDKFVILSNYVIANKKHPTQMAYLQDIYLIYRHTASMNFIRYINELVLENRNKKNSMRINTYAKSGADKDRLTQLLAQACPNARFGWNRENLNYLDEMRKRNNYNNY